MVSAGSLLSELKVPSCHGHEVKGRISVVEPSGTVPGTFTCLGQACEAGSFVHFSGEETEAQRGETIISRSGLTLPPLLPHPACDLPQLSVTSQETIRTPALS